MTRRLVLATACLMVSGALWPGGASAKRVDRIREFGVGEVPHYLAAGPDGNVWFTSAPRHPLFGPGSVGRVSPRGGVARFREGLNARNDLGALIAGPGGNVWFADRGSPPGIGLVTPQGVITEFSAGMHPDGMPWSMAVGPDGNVWFTHTPRLRAPAGAAAIGQITPQGAITEFRAGLNPRSVPDQIVVGSDGNLWFIDRENEAIGRVGTGLVPANRFVTLAPKRVRADGAARLRLAVPSAGKARLEAVAIVAKRRVIPLRRRNSSVARSTGCGRATLRIRPDPVVRAGLRRAGAVRLRVRIRFKPYGGKVRRRMRTVVLRRRPSG